MKEPKLCKDCRWTVQPRWWGYQKCTHPDARKHGSTAFFLYGDPYFLPKCEDVRHPHSSCGHDGKLWDPTP